MQRNITVNSDDTKIIQPIFEVIWEEFYDLKGNPLFPRYYKIEKWAKEGTEFNDWSRNKRIGQPTLLLYKSNVDGSTEHPYPLPAKDAAMFVQGWLGNLTGQDFPEEYDGDGSSRRGFWFSTEDLYKFNLNGLEPEIVIRPHWIFYHK